MNDHLGPRANRLRVALGSAAALLGLLAGPAAQAHAKAEHRRYIVSLVNPSDDLKATRKLVHRTGGVPVEAIRALSPSQVAVTLRCRSAARCDAALSRLSSATSWVRSVDVDAVRTLPAPVPASAAR